MGTYEWDDSSPATAVVEAVAAECGCKQEELAALYDVIDPDALEAFFETGASRHRHRCIEFDYAGYEIAVSGDRRIEVTRAEEPLAC